MVNLIAAVALFISAGIAACSGDDAQSRYAELDGTWFNADIPMTVVIDTDTGTYSGTAMGMTLVSQMTFLEQDGDTLRLSLESERGGSVIYCRFFDDGRILLRKEVDGALPLTFVRVGD